MKSGILNGMCVTLHENTLGTTEPALQAMRNELATRIRHKLVVCEVPADNARECYGFIIVDHTTGEDIIIGDGFRADGGGTGGAGHRAIQAFLLVMGIRPIQLGPEEAVPFTEQVLHYLPALDAARLFEPSIPAFNNRPYYIDSVLR